MTEQHPSAIGGRPRWPRWTIVGTVLLAAAYCLVLSRSRTLHSFRITGSGPEILITVKDRGFDYNTSTLKDGMQDVQSGIKDALVRLDSGRIAVYSSLRPEPVKLELPSTLRPMGDYEVRVSNVHGVLYTTITGRATSIRYTDQSMGSKRNLEKYGSELVPSVLEEQRNASLAAAGVMFAVLQLLQLLLGLFRK